MTAWSPLHAHVHQTLRSRTIPSPSHQGQGLLPKHSHILIAISGGQDSQCLLRLMVDLQDKWHWQLHGIHCNHRWRSDADDNAAFVKDTAAEWGVPCTVQTATHPLNSEAAARNWRYQVFTHLAQGLQYTHVVTGHTASDRAETLLYNLTRGSGMDGLQALTWHRPLSDETPGIALVRPLLNVTREETGQFCQEHAIPVWEDATNQDKTYARNRLRLDVLPLLRDYLNPQVDSSLAQTAEILTAEVAYLEQAALTAYKQCVEAGNIQRRILRESALALQRRVIRQVLSQQLCIQPQFDHVEKVVALIHAPNRSQTDPFPGGAIAIVDDPWIRLSLPPK